MLLIESEAGDRAWVQLGQKSGAGARTRLDPKIWLGRIDPASGKHDTLPFFVRIQHFVFAAADARLENLDASHQTQFPSELMRIERALCLAPAFGEVPHARETDWFAVPIGSLEYMHGRIVNGP
jgi:hypothetical protein